MHAVHDTVCPDGTQGMAATTPTAAVPLLDFLSQRQAQARDNGAAYLAPVPDENAMVFWLSAACKAARELTDRRQVHIAAEANVDQSTIARFEDVRAWPKRPDHIVNAYASDLELDPYDLWEEALRMWREYREGRGDAPPDISPPR